MTGDHYQRADNGSVLRAAMVAVMLIAAGLGLMVWDNQRDARKGAVTVSVLHNP